MTRVFTRLLSGSPAGSFVLAGLLAGGLVFSGCDSENDPLRFEVTVDSLALPTARGSLAPFLVAEDTAWMSWIEPSDAGHRLRIARFDGAGWTVTGAMGTPARWFVNWADVPSIEPSGDGRLWAHWMEYVGEGRYAYGVRIARSDDEGATWSDPAWLHEDLSESEHGFAALVGDEAGGVTAVWLDGAAYAAGGNEMSVRARTIDADGTKGPEAILDERSCDCCPNAAIRLASGRILAAYRDRSSDEIRDIRVVSMDGAGWSDPAVVHADGWQISACPVNGPALAAAGDRVAMAWFTMANGAPAVFVAFSEDGGDSFEDPIRVDEGSGLGRVDLVGLDDGTAVVTWIEARGTDPDAPAGIMARRVAADGHVSEARELVATAQSRAAGYPRMVRSGEDLLLAWTQVDPESRVRAARVRFRR